MDLLVEALQKSGNITKDKLNLRDATETTDSGNDSSESIYDESDSDGGDSDQDFQEVLDDLFVYVAADGHLDRAQSL